MDSAASLQHRDDSKLEEIPDLDRGTADSILSEKAMQDWEVVYNDTIPVLPTESLETELDLSDGSEFDPQNDSNLSQSHLDEVNKQWQRYKTELENKKKVVTKLNLQVKQFSQNDSETDEGERMCASSVMSMAIHYLAPGLITPEMLKEAGYSQLDDYYLKELIEKQGGNTNDPDFHIKVFRQLGFNAQLVKNASWTTIDNQLRDGIPVPMVIAHHGHASEPDLERWHWILCRGKAEGSNANSSHIYNDPNGELNVVNGGYTRNLDGASMQYSDKNLTPRWQTDGPNQGWAVILKRPFPKAKVVDNKKTGNPGNPVKTVEKPTPKVKPEIKK